MCVCVYIYVYISKLFISLGSIDQNFIRSTIAIGYFDNVLFTTLDPKITRLLREKIDIVTSLLLHDSSQVSINKR